MDLTNLKAPGRLLVFSVLDDLGKRNLTLDPIEERWLLEAARISDQLAAVERRIARDGLLVENVKSGAVRGNPLLAERRGLRGDLLRVLRQLDLDPKPEPAQGDLSPADKYRQNAHARGGRRRAARIAGAE